MTSMNAHKKYFLVCSVLAALDAAAEIIGVGRVRVIDDFEIDLNCIGQVNDALDSEGLNFELVV